MSAPKIRRIIFKSISLAISLIFFFEQMAMAGDPISIALDNLNAAQNQTFAPAYLQSQQTAVESLIEQKQTIEDTLNLQNAQSQPSDTDDTGLSLKGPIGGVSTVSTQSSATQVNGLEAQPEESARISLTTQAGDIIHYLDGAIDFIERADGTVLRNITIDSNNDLVGSDVTYTDGTYQLMKDGRLIKTINPDGTIINYNPDEMISQVVYPGGGAVTYTYTKNSTGAITGIILKNSNGTVTNYDANGKLAKVNKPDGTVVEYIAGIISKIIKSDGKVFKFSSTPIRDNAIPPPAAPVDLFAKYGIQISGSGIILSTSLSELVRKLEEEVAAANASGAYAAASSQASEDLTRQTKVLLKQYIDEAGNAYNYTDGSLSSVRVKYKGIFYEASVNADGSLKNDMLTLEDRTKIYFSNGYVSRAVISDGSVISFDRSTDGALLGASKTKYNQFKSKYIIDGNSIKAIDSGSITYEFINGLITRKTTAAGQATVYIREYDVSGNPLRVLASPQASSATTYLFNTSGQLSAIGNDGNCNSSDIRYFDSTPQSLIAAQNYTGSTGITVTDGKYLYVRKAAGESGSGGFIKIGTGLRGTAAGRKYGEFSGSSLSYSAAYHSDGFIYSPTPNSFILEKINAVTGIKTQVTIPSGLTDYKGGTEGTMSLITSDGRHIYNVAGSADTGWNVKVFDPQNNWQVVKNYTINGPSYDTGSIMADGIYLYCIEKASGGSRRITISRISDGVIVNTYNFSQETAGGQYDWVNNKFWFGSASSNKVSSYAGIIQKTQLSYISTDGFFKTSTLVRDIIKTSDYRPVVVPPSEATLDSAMGCKELVYDAGAQLESAIKYDGTRFTFKNGMFESVTDASGDVVTYSFDYSDIGNVLHVDTVGDGIKRFYDLKGDLKSITTADDTNIRYNGNDVSSISYSDGTALLYTGGCLEEAVDKDGTRFMLGADGKPTRGIDKHGNVYNYSYFLDTVAGKDVTIIEDVARNEKRRYEDGLLVRAEGADGYVSKNAYFENGNIESATVTKRGRVIDTYIYTYKSDGTAEVRDLQGNIKTYGQDGKLTRVMEPDGKVYKYSYPGSITMRSELINYTGAMHEDLIVATEYINNVLHKVYRANGSFTAYTFDGKIDYISNADGRILIDYGYNEAGELTAIVMAGARHDLEESADEANDRIDEERANALARLAAEHGAVIDEINARVAPDLNSLISQRDSLRNQWNNLNGQNVGWDPFGDKRKAKSRALDDFGRAIDQVNTALSQAYGQLADAYSQVDVQVAALRDDIDSEVDGSLTRIMAEEEELLFEISKQEAASFVLYCYRNILGRDLDKAEVSGWLNILSADHQNIDRSTIVESILASNEYNMRKVQVDAIKSGVRESLESYLSLSSSEERSLFLATLGLAAEDAVALAAEDAGDILKWLDSQGLHFGQSAFLTLNDMLILGGVSCDTTDLAVKVILTDILAGSIDIFTEGDIELSMFALSKYAETKGQVLYNTKLTFDDLVAQFTTTSRAIAHIDGNHYIVITGIDGGEIHYREENKGASGTDEVMSKDDFLKKWSGYTITKSKPQDEVKIISAPEAKKIKGAFFAFLIPLIGAIIGAVSGIITGIVSTVGAIIAGVAGVVSAALVNITGLIASVGSQLITGIGAVFSGIGSAIGGFLGASSLAAVLKTIVGVGLSFGINAGLQAIGVNSTISNLTSAFLTGGILSFFNPVAGAGMLGAFMSEGLKYATISGINELAPRLNLDPSISGILSITAGALVDGLWQGDIGGKILKIAPNVASEFAYYGVTKLGDLAGIDPRISYLVGVGIRSTINAGLTHEFVPDVIWGSVQNGLLRGITNVALEWGAESLGLSPLIGSLTSAAIAGGLEALLMGQNPVQGVFDTYFRAGVGLLTLGGDGGNNSWLRAAYISQVLDFSRIIKERGIINSLETYSSGFLKQQTINEIWKQGGIAELLAKPKQIEMTTNRKGEVVKRIYTMNITSEADKLISNYIDLSPTYDMLVGFREGNVITHCEFVVGPDGKPQLKNGEREIFNSDGSERIEYVENFNLNKMDYIDKYGTKIGYYVPATGTSSIIVDSDGKILSGKFTSLIADYSVATKDGQVINLSLKRDYAFSETQRTNLLNAGYAEQDLSGFKEIVSIANGVLQYFVLPPDTAIFNINKAESKAWLDSIEADGRAFWQGAYSLLRDAVAGDPLPQLSSNSVYPYANIELKLVLPGRSEGLIAELDLLNVVTGDITNPLGSFVTQNSTWNHNTSYSAQLYAASFGMGYKFVFGGGAKFLLSGEGSNRLDWGNLNTFYGSLNTTNTIGVGFSADTVSIVKSWLIPNAAKADHYFLLSPQLSPKELEEFMRIGGISPDMVTVVETSGDFPGRWFGSFSDNKDSNKTKKWDYVKIVSGPDVNLLNPFSSHGVPVRGVVDGGQYIVEVNGVRSADPVSLADIYSYFANRNNSN